MKKKIIFSTLIILAFAASAQDTVRYLDPWYAFTDKGILSDCVDVDCLYFSNVPCGETVNDTSYISYVHVFSNRNYTNLYGIAVTVDDVATDISTLKFYVYRNCSIIPHSPTFFYWPQFQQDTLVPQRDNTKKCTFEYEYDVYTDSTQKSNFAHCYEFYFDQPISIASEDTIYVGLRWCGNYKLVYGVDTTKMQNAYALNVNKRYMPTAFYLCSKDVWGGFFPIVGLRCTAPRDFRLCDEAVPTACWRGDTNAITFQMSVCNSLVEPELGSLSTVYDTSINLSSLHPDSAYMVYLRKMCTFVCADTVWSDWSGPIVIGDTTGWASHNIGIADASLVDITLTPNPASECVTVSATGMQSVELLAVDGTVILHRDGLHQDEYTLDLKGLVAGLYMVRVGTPLGTATRRLLVQ